MSIENHPNINAAGWTSDIIRTYMERLRGPAANVDRGIAVSVLADRITDFVVGVSEALDNQFGEGRGGG